MNKHRLLDYMNYRGLDNGGLIPEPDMLGEIANEAWWTECSEHFNQIIWMDYFDRTVLLNEKFPFDPANPEDTDNMDTTTGDILFTFAFHLKANARKYKMMYEAYNAEFNPLYNVDAFEFEDRTLAQTGTDTNKKTGNDDTVRSGNQEMEKLGTEAVTKTGNLTDVESGSRTTTTATTTDDSSTWYDTEKVTDTPSLATNTTTYNSVADTTSFTGRKDKTSYNNVSDKTTYNSQDELTKNLLDTEHITRRRYGNIGVTKSTELLSDTFDFSEKYLNLFKTIIHNCVNTCTYMVE